MTADEFRARLEALGLSQPGFARVVSGAGGEPLPLGTVRGWAQGRRAIPVTVPALLSLLASCERVASDRDLAECPEHHERDAGGFAPGGDHDGIHALEGA
jgi:hypothetical protein